MLRSTPTPASSTSSDEPPYETKGSGIPVSGAMPEDGREVDCGLAADERRDPGREPLAKGSRHSSATRKPTQAKTAKPPIRSAEPISPSSSPTTAKIMSVWASGQEVDLLDPLAEPLAGDAARAHPDDRLDVLEARALRVLPRVEEAEQARAAVRLHVDREQRPARSASVVASA